MKKVVSVIMSVVFIFSFNLTALAKQNDNGKSATATEHKNDNGDKKLGTATKKLDMIQQDILKVMKQIDIYSNSTISNTVDTTTGSSTTDVTTGRAVTEGSSAITTESAVSVDEEDKDIEQEDEEFETENYGTSLVGKLNALNNRLEGVKSSILQKLNDKLEQKEYKPAESTVNTDKVWTIHFNKKLDSNIINKLNIFVVDSNNDPVSVQLGYDSSTGSVDIKVTEGFKPGEAYTLFISKDVKATDNTSLKDAVKMQFTVK